MRFLASVSLSFLHSGKLASLVDRVWTKRQSLLPEEDQEDFDLAFSIGPNALKWVLDDESVIHVGVILKNVGKYTKKSLKFKQQFTILFQSILEQSRRNAIHFLLFTDREGSVDVLTPILRNKIRRLAHVKVTFDFFDCRAISRRFADEISRLRPHFTSIAEQAEKYRDDLFLMAPFYHRVLPYDRFIMLDADLRFMIPIEELYDHFNAFESSAVMGVAPDLSHHYMWALREFRNRTPDTKVGEPGRMQGFNTGVVLMDLTRMRSSRLYNKYVALDLYDETSTTLPVDELAEKYSFSSHLGDQCFFSLLGMEHPELFHPLPCEYNYQLDTMMWVEPFIEIFPRYHNCTVDPKIYHGNGGFSIPLTAEEEDEVRWRWPPRTVNDD